MPVMSFACDLCVIGGGEAGFNLAQAGVALGLKVVLIDSSVNDPCWRNWEVALAVFRRSAGEVGRKEASGGFGNLQFSLDRALHAAAPDRRFARLAAMNVQVIRGRARFKNDSTVEAAEQTVRARRFVLATGAKPAAGQSGVFSHASLLERLRTGDAPSRFSAFRADERSVAVAMTLARLGVNAALHAPEGLLPGHDPELLTPIRHALRASGVNLVEGATAYGESPAHEGSVDYAPATEPALVDLDPAAAGLDLCGGRLGLTPALRTSNPRIYAVGGVAGARSSQEAQAQIGIVLRSAFFRLPGQFNPAQIPRCVETSPGLASVGLDEATARAKGPVTVWRWPLAETPAGAAHPADGFVKIVADRRGLILGAGIVGPDATEQIGIWTMAIRARMTLADIATLPLPSPSLAEASRRAASQFLAQRLRSPWTKRVLTALRWLP